jgi:hypothetical protein
MENISWSYGLLHLIPRRIWQLLLLMGILILILVLMVGCNSNSTISTTTGVTTTTVVSSSTEKPRTVSYFPVQNKDPGVYIIVKLEGKLDIDINGYLTIQQMKIIWPYGYSYKVEGGDISILDERGNLAAKSGEEVILGGYSSNYIGNEMLVQPHPSIWDGPFWLANPLNYYPPTSTTIQ